MDAALDLLVGEESEPAFVRLDVHKDGGVSRPAEFDGTISNFVRR
jgi:hypothetical protein